MSDIKSVKRPRDGAKLAGFRNGTRAPAVGYDALMRELETVESHRETVHVAIARRLLEYLSKGDFQPGDRIPSERQLAEVLGIGRSAVRDALKPLALLGLLDIRQGHGTFLKSTESKVLPDAIEWGLFIGARRTRDLFEARCHLEMMVVGIAAERRSEQDVEHLRDLIVKMRASSRDPATFVRADVEFHHRIAEASNNQTLLQIMTSISSLLQVWIARVMRNEHNFQSSMNEHFKVFEAIEARDADRAREAMRLHVWAALGRLDEELAKA